MAAYPKSYLAEIVENQGKLFELVSDSNPQIDMEDFIKKYMVGKTRMFLDRADAYLSNMDSKELYEFFCRIDSFTPRNGRNIDGFRPNWIGQFYAYYQWQTGLPSKKVLEKLPIDFMEASYYGLHDLDLDLAVTKIQQAEVA